MSDQDLLPNKYSELRSIHRHYIDCYIALYQLKTKDEKELNTFYTMIKSDLIHSNKCHPYDVVKDILNIIPFNNRYTKSYLKLAKDLSDDYQVTEVRDIPTISNYLFYKEYGIILDKNSDFKKITSENLEFHTKDTIYRAIMDNNLESFISFTERNGFDKFQKFESSLYPYDYLNYDGYSLLELCCYHGAVDCFKFLRTKFNSKITQKCLQFSFLGGNPEIMSECLKYRKPDEKCMEYAIISHNIDFVTFLMNEYNININLDYCRLHKNLDSFLVYFDQTNAVDKCFINSIMFCIPSLCKYFLSNGANINEKDKDGYSALYIVTLYNYKEMIELLISHGININEKDKNGYTALHFAARKYNRKEMIEILLSHGANINEKDTDGNTALHIATFYNYKETVELLLSHGANINEKNNIGKTALHYASKNNYKEMTELLLSHGANINEKDKDGKTALHIAARNNNKDIVKLHISYSVNINEKDKDGYTVFHIAVLNNFKETTDLLLSHGANINEKNNIGRTALHFAARKNNRKEMTELLLSHGANINEKDKDGKTALHIAARNNNKDIVKLHISYSVNINEKDNYGQTALHIAAWNGCKEIAELLISHGININE
ncbi:ankyrin repeat protein, putative [Trichomonas vaginalis G3]|uniref:Ankyrin repeat protein, putative n=1 Tax=Trichomonas vaginalis (strain ATCC PRA-98 / G3) TaxID=412133 RepID=A2F6E9_TRIV3|nr:ankyrin repeat, PH and SEC7 domain containing protein SECG-related family [Trichomonas vaginalis G3]EAX99507.1 ankyrin repeat protein, putative [Trichomonas vaginalis G3]KAI5535641.1 ankyrin repeat, PH and SEC7 domain containing protein SECG-related family [Trichomonas vaginalis G3]|eukprot:XP_001312437.1 ankyrin repeat protein [Trichomonas vaginalis G3]